MTTLAHRAHVASAFKHNAQSLIEFTGGLHFPPCLAGVSGVPGASAFSPAPSIQPRDGEVLPVEDRQPGHFDLAQAFSFGDWPSSFPNTKPSEVTSLRGF